MKTTLNDTKLHAAGVCLLDAMVGTTASAIRAGVAAPRKLGSRPIRSMGGGDPSIAPGEAVDLRGFHSAGRPTTVDVLLEGESGAGPCRSAS